MQSQEETQIIADLRYFLEQHAESRFTDWFAKGSEEAKVLVRTHHRAGFRKTTGDGIEFYFFPETFRRDICKGHDEKFAEKVLYKHGLLKRGTEGKFQCSAKPLSEAKSQRFYLITLASVAEDSQ